MMPSAAFLQAAARALHAAGYKLTPPDICCECDASGLSAGLDRVDGDFWQWADGDTLCAVCRERHMADNPAAYDLHDMAQWFKDRGYTEERSGGADWSVRAWSIGEAGSDGCGIYITEDEDAEVEVPSPDGVTTRQAFSVLYRDWGVWGDCGSITPLLEGATGCEAEAFAAAVVKAYADNAGSKLWSLLHDGDTWTVVHARLAPNGADRMPYEDACTLAKGMNDEQ